MRKLWSILIVLLLAGCSWPKVEIAGDEYLFSPIPPGESISLPDSTGGSGSGSGSSGIKPSEPLKQE